MPDERRTRLDPARPRWDYPETEVLPTQREGHDGYPQDGYQQGGYPQADYQQEDHQPAPQRPQRKPSRLPEFDIARLWAGGGATAVVAALLAVVGILFARGLLEVAVLAPKGEGAWGNANTVTYALVCAGVALLATGLMHLLALTTPDAPKFFGWIMVLATLIAVVLPLSLTVDRESRFTTAALNLVIGIVITVLVRSVAASAARKRETWADPRATR
jgi:hypothetical protein